MRISFQDELHQLEAAIQEEGDLVLRALRSALNALARGDDELADEVIAFDDEIDQRYLAIETGVQSLLARQTPVATDLRLVLAMLRVNLHLERMADYCVTVAKLTKLVHDTPPDPTLTEALEDMGSRAEEMIQTALESFANRDVEAEEGSHVCDARGLLHVVRDDDERVVAFELGHQVLDRLRRDRVEGSKRTGVLVEYDDTPTIFTHPADKRTEDYVTGRFG